MDIEGVQNVVRNGRVIKDESVGLWVGSHNVAFMITHVGFVGGKVVGVGIPISKRCEKIGVVGERMKVMVGRFVAMKIGKDTM